MNTIALERKLAPEYDRIAGAIGNVFIIASQEPTDLLEKALIKENLQYQVLRQERRPEYEKYSRSYLALMNHRRAWKRAIEQSKPTLVIEADFVPVVGFGKLPLPFNPRQKNVGICWLYTCASQVYSISDEGYAEGFSVSAVAYIITPQAAKYLLELAAEIHAKWGPNIYSTWDADIDKFLREKSLKNYIPFRNYGEHGGLPNLEHYKYGLSKKHRADVLYGKLAFKPFYTCRKRKGKESFLVARLQARLKGILRLITGKFLRFAVIKGSSVSGRLIWFAISRQLVIRL